MFWRVLFYKIQRHRARRLQHPARCPNQQQAVLVAAFGTLEKATKWVLGDPYVHPLVEAGGETIYARDVQVGAVNQT